MWSTRILICSLALGIGACGGSVSGSGGGGTAGSGGTIGTGGTTASGGTAGTGGVTGTGGTTTSTSSTVGPTGCPLAEPAVNGACDVAALRCSYGDSPVPSCRRGYVCQGGQWNPDGLGCDTDPPACSTDKPAGTMCAEQSTRCLDGDLLCACAPCGGAGCPPPPYSWVCAPPPDTGCPPAVPNDGTACADGTLVCSYGVFCFDEATARCVDGAWKWDPILACP